MLKIRILFNISTFTLIALFWICMNRIHQSPVSSLTSQLVFALDLSSSKPLIMHENLTTSMLPQISNGIFDRRVSSSKDINILRGYSVESNMGKDSDHNDDSNIQIKENGNSILQLQRYKIDDIVSCLDSLFVKKNCSLYIAFMGDSLMRNQFKNFIEFIPEYDRITSLNQTNPYTITRYHEDNNVTSKLLNNILVSFHWNALINDKLISTLKYWAYLEDHQTPDIIFIGPTVHHMLEELYNLNGSYSEIVEHDLLPVLLSYLSNHPRKQIIWKIQSPTADILHSISSHPFNNLIHVKKINDFNKIVQRLFRGTGIAVWDSLLPVVEEYMRSCALQRFLRSDDTRRWWCGDFLHYGRLVSAIGSQQIFNHLCNSL